MPFNHAGQENACVAPPPAQPANNNENGRRCAKPAATAPPAAGTIARKRWNILAKALTTHGNNNATVHSALRSSIASIPSASSSSSSSSSFSSSSSSSPLSPSSSTDSAELLPTAAADADDMRASVRRFASFDLMQQDSLSTDCRDQLVGSCRDWSTYRLGSTAPGAEPYSVNIHHINRPITALDLMGFNNTGNICVWPSEEALAVHALARLDTFTNKMVLELGGGMTCLAGLLVAKYGRPYGVHLTDGNALSVENVRKTCRLNDVRDCYVKCSVLQWEQHAQAERLLRCPGETFDYILSADCLFFDEARAALVDTMWACLAGGGTALVMAPRRGRTMADFVRVAEAKGFRCAVVVRYNEAIWRRHLELKAEAAATYDEDIHYPILIELTK